jgi:hypothetical protein
MGVSTVDYPEVLQARLSLDTKCVSPNVIVRPKQKCGQEYEEWSRRVFSSEELVYLWADGIQVRGRLEDEGNQEQCLLVLMGAGQIRVQKPGFCPSGLATECHPFLSRGPPSEFGNSLVVWFTRGSVTRMFENAA